MKLDTSQENGERIIIPTKYKTNILDKLLTFTGHKELKQLLRVLETRVNNLPPAFIYLVLKENGLLKKDIVIVKL